jgi:hypothetical protein
MLVFYVCAAAALALVIAGVAVFKPLRLRYSVYVVRKNPDYPPSEHMRRCHEAALEGSRLAMETCIFAYYREQVSVHTGPRGSTGRAFMRNPLAHASDCYELASGQTALFFDVLAGRSLAEVVGVLHQVDAVLPRVERGESGWASVRMRPPEATAECLWEQALDLELFADSKSAEVRRVAGAALEFLRRHYGREIAEVEKREAEAEAEAKKKRGGR